MRCCFKLCSRSEYTYPTRASVFAATLSRIHMSMTGCNPGTRVKVSGFVVAKWLHAMRWCPLENCTLYRSRVLSRKCSRRIVISMGHPDLLKWSHRYLNPNLFITVSVFGCLGGNPWPPLVHDLGTTQFRFFFQKNPPPGNNFRRGASTSTAWRNSKW